MVTKNINKNVESQKNTEEQKFIIKVSIKDLEAYSTTNNAASVLLKKLQEDKANAYTINGLLVECFGLKEETLKMPFKTQPNEYINLYSKVIRALKALLKDEKIYTKKCGKSFFFWAV